HPRVGGDGLRPARAFRRGAGGGQADDDDRREVPRQGHECVDAPIPGSRGATCDPSESYVPFPPQVTPRTRNQYPDPSAGVPASTTVVGIALSATHCSVELAKPPPARVRVPRPPLTMSYALAPGRASHDNVSPFAARVVM